VNPTYYQVTYHPLDRYRSVSYGRPSPWGEGLGIARTRWGAQRIIRKHKRLVAKSGATNSLDRIEHEES
jgi:hypothetical protein